MFAAGIYSGGHGPQSRPDHGTGHTHVMTFGAPGKAGDVSRTIEVLMKDNEYNMATLEVEDGQTVRFVIKNVGDLLHEFNIGAPHMHEEHQAEMIWMFENGMMDATSISHKMVRDMAHSKAVMKHMKHDDPNAVLLEPGQTRELIWKFRKSDGLEFACNIPGHYQSGMVGTIKIVSRRSD